MKKMCRGCNIIGRSERTFCSFRLAKNEDNCACVECLVKVMCKQECHKRLRSRYNLMDGKSMGEFIDFYREKGKT